MIMWMLVALVGGALSVAGLITLGRRYLRGEITRRSLLAFVVGYLGLVSYALLSALRPEITTGAVTLVMLLPVFIAIVVIIREHQRAHLTDGSSGRSR
jgi:drug/metabolite transporter (DMT)-like permease